MKWLSEGVEALVALLKRNQESNSGKFDFDAVVVGSGYGGAVAAMRLADAGYSVCVLERGEEYVPGEFPNDIANLPKHIRFSRADRAGVIGRDDGLFDIRAHGTVTTLVGNALGGTSQINANVAMRADPDVFDDEHWPEALRGKPAELESYYDKVEQVLGATNGHGRKWIKGSVLERFETPLAQHLKGLYPNSPGAGAQFHELKLAITLSDNTPSSANVLQNGCTGCGDCITGCNVGAKNTLTMNYLPLAVEKGAKLYCGATVLAVQPKRGEGASVYFRYTDLDQVGPRDEDGRQLRAQFVVLAAGALGSTEILLRSQQQGLIACSAKLGRRFSGNGDGLHFGFDQDSRVNAIGFGADRARYNRNGSHRAPGPAIVSALKVRSGKPQEKPMLIEDGIIPGPLAHATHELLTTAGILSQLESQPMKRDGPRSDPAALADDALRRAQVYLAVGHDNAGGRIYLKHDRASVFWRKAPEQPCVGQQEQYLKATEKALDATYIGSPSLKPLPSALGRWLSGPAIKGTALVVHPLGGCPMGDAKSGAVNDIGELYDSKEGTYGSVYVWDGSIIPCSLGANPFLTIAALAERAVDKLIKSGRFKASGATPATRPALPAASMPARPGGRDVAVVLRETMRGRLNWYGWWNKGVNSDGTASAALEVRMNIDNLVAILRSPRHRITGINGRLNMPALSAKALTVYEGTIDLLPPQACGRRWGQIRALVVWAIKRGLQEAPEFLRRLRHPKPGAPTLGEYVKGIWNLAYHVGETRHMRYELKARDAANNKHYAISGSKTVRYGLKTNVWSSLLELDASIYRRGRLFDRKIADGCLRLDLIALGGHDYPQIRLANDLPNALGALGSFLAFFLRVILKLHIWDFRAPDYAKPRPIPRHGRIEVRELASGRTTFVDPLTYPLLVAGGGHTRKDKIELALTRYTLRGHASEGKGRRFPVLLLHGYAQSSWAFRAPQLEEDLVRHLLARNFDVWLLDYRTSTALKDAKQQWTLDDVARHDIPSAVDMILANTPYKQVMAFGHCMGAATLAMSMLSGRLKNGAGPKIYKAVFSQVPPFVIGGYYSQYRRQLAALLRDVVGVEGVKLAADDQLQPWEAVMDRLLATLPTAIELEPFGERKPHDCEDVPGPKPRTDVPTCKRVSGLIGPLYLHQNMHKSHAHLHEYFGWGSISILAQVGKLFEYERLVSADGENLYVTDDNIRQHLSMPIGLLHGNRNQVFDIESSRRTRKRINNVCSQEPCVMFDIDRDYAHFDCLAGDRAHVDVFPKISQFLAEDV